MEAGRTVRSYFNNPGKVTEDGDLDQVVTVERVKTGWILDIFLMVKSTGFPERSEVKCERNKNDLKVFHLSKWKDRIVINWSGENF